MLYYLDNIDFDGGAAFLKAFFLGNDVLAQGGAGGT